jgi:hypothetical protein
MSITLNEHQFNALLNKTMGKSKTRSIKLYFINAPTFTNWLQTFEFLPVSKLMSYSMPEYYIKTIMLNINNCTDNMRPLLCSDTRRKKFYYKVSDSEWLKDDRFIEQCYKAIYRNATEQILHKYTNYNDDDDEYDDNTSAKQGSQYEKMEILRTLCDVDKYPFHKLMNKILIGLAKEMKQDTETNYTSD